MMKNQFEQRNLSMVMDFYEMTMSNGYFQAGDTETTAVFDVFFRKNPDNAGFSIFGGKAHVDHRRLFTHGDPQLVGNVIADRHAAVGWQVPA